MKNSITQKLFLTIPFLILAVCITFAQTIPPGIPYQAIARNANGTPYVNAALTVRFSLHEQTATGTVSYSESHSLQTNDLGLFSTTFGNGTPITGTFSAINWAQTTKFLQVEINLGSAWVDLGTQQLMSVPYAMYAGTAANVTISKGVRIGFSQSGIWTCPNGVTQVSVELWGAGGGGCLCIVPATLTAFPGSPGGKGGYNKGMIPVIPGQSYSITIGSAGCSASGNGNSGGTTSFGTFITAHGGGGAIYESCGSTIPGTDGAVSNWPYLNWSAASIGYLPSSLYDNNSIVPSLASGGSASGGCGQNGFLIIAY